MSLQTTSLSYEQLVSPTVGSAISEMGTLFDLMTGLNDGQRYSKVILENVLAIQTLCYFDRSFHSEHTGI